MFAGLFRMHETCSICGLKFEREPGYFLGSIYINYGFAALATTAAWMVLRYQFDLPRLPVAWGLLLFCVLSGALFFRYARALWLAMDCRFEKDPFFDIHLTASRGSHARD
jgi:hypothetical protein